MVLWYVGFLGVAANRPDKQVCANGMYEQSRTDKIAIDNSIPTTETPVP